MTVENISISVRTNADKAASKLSSLVSAMENVKKAADNMVEGTGDISVSISRAAKKAEKEFEPLSSEMQKTIKDANKYQVLVHKAADASVKMEKAFEKGNEAAAWREREKEINATTQAQKEFLKNQPKVASKPVSSEIQEFLTNANAIDLLKFRIESLNAEMQKAFQSGDANKAANYRQQIINATAALQKQEEALKGVEEQSKKTEKHHSKFLASIKRIAMYRMLRTALKEITQGFNEGLKNAYNFSKGINGSLAVALDSLATKSLTMKNQMGAAFGALLQAVMPVILQIISLITRLMQALSALFAAIGGGQYLIAKDVAKGWDEATGGAKEYKKTLLGFDEINRLDDNSGGGGGGGSDWANMFEEGQLPKWAQWIKDHLDEILTVVKAIGLAIAAWKFGTILGDLFGVQLGFQQLLGLAASVAGAFLIVNGAIDAFKNGATWKNVNEMLYGTAILAGGLALMFGKVGAAIGLVVGGLALLATGLRGWIQDGQLSEQELYALQGGLLAVGAGIALLTGSWIPLLIGALAGVVLQIGTHTEEINAKIDSFFDGAITKITTFIEKIETKTGLNLSWLKREITYTLNYLRYYIEGVVIKIGWLVEDLGRIVKAVADGDWTEAMNAIKQTVADANVDVAGKAVEMATSVTNFSDTGSKVSRDFSREFSASMQEARDESSETVNSTNSLKDALDLVFGSITGNVPSAKTTFKGFTDGIIDGANNAQTPLQNFLNKLSSILSTLQSIAGISIDGGLLGLLSGNGWNFNFSVADAFGFSARAAGGFPDTGELFIAREAGPELVGTINGHTAVANNDQIVEAVASGVYEAVSSAMSNTNDRPMQVRVYLDSREIRTGQNRLARAMGV